MISRNILNLGWSRPWQSQNQWMSEMISRNVLNLGWSRPWQGQNQWFYESL